MRKDRYYLNTQANLQKNGHLIAVGGMVFALIGFFLMPFVTLSYIYTQSQYSQSQYSQSQIPSYTYSALQAAAFQGFIWLDALLAVAILLLALLLAFGRNPFGMSQVPLERQVQQGAYALIGASAASIVVQFIVMKTIPGGLVGIFSSMFSSAGSASSSYQSLLNTLTTSYATGSWFYLIGMLIAIGAEIYVLRALRPAAAIPTQMSSPMQNPSSPYRPGQYPNQQPGQYPMGQYPVQPAPEQYPQQQYPQQQYPQQQQAWQPPQSPVDYR